MLDKFEVYDLLGVLVPGVLVVAATPLAFPWVAMHASTVRFPDAFTVAVLTALAVFAGQLVQSLGSLAEPLLNKTWGGRPSDVALSLGLGSSFFPLDSAMRIRSKLVAGTTPAATDAEL
jgi:hypothetical protein